MGGQHWNGCDMIPINSVSQRLKSMSENIWPPWTDANCHLMVCIELVPSLWCIELLSWWRNSMNFCQNWLLTYTCCARHPPGNEQSRLALFHCLSGTKPTKSLLKEVQFLKCFDHDTHLISSQQGSSMILPWHTSKTTVTADLALRGWTQIAKWTWCKLFKHTSMIFYDGYLPGARRTKGDCQSM